MIVIIASTIKHFKNNFSFPSTPILKLGNFTKIISIEYKTKLLTKLVCLPNKMFVTSICVFDWFTLGLEPFIQFVHYIMLRGTLDRIILN